MKDIEKKLMRELYMSFSSFFSNGEDKLPECWTIIQKLVGNEKNKRSI